MTVVQIMVFFGISIAVALGIGALVVKETEKYNKKTGKTDPSL